MQFQMEKEKNVFTENHEEKNNKTLGPQRLKQCVRFQPHNQTPTSYIKFKMFFINFVEQRENGRETKKREEGKRKE